MDGKPPPDDVQEASPRREAPGVLDRALALVEYLRRECPWDREQTARSLVPHLLEESQETAEAVLHGSADELEGELGDLLLNVAFQIVVAEEDGSFDRDGVVERLERKMRRRHPHLFGQGGRPPEPGAWERIKARERRERGTGEGVLEGLPRGLDALLRAHRIQDRVSGVGFDWEEPRGALEKVREELDEVDRALEQGDAEAIEEELGDLLFSVVNLSRRAGLHAKVALEGANAKFEGRFTRLEALARERGLSLGETPLEALDALWEEVKLAETAPEDRPTGEEGQ